MGLLEEEKLKKELGHYPVIKTLQVLVVETQKLIKELDRSGQKQHLAWMSHAERFLVNQGEELKSLLNFLKKASCFEKVSRALNLDISLGKKAPRELEKILESLENEQGQSPNMVNIYEAIQAQVVSYWLDKLNPLVSSRIERYARIIVSSPSSRAPFARNLVMC